MNRGAGLNGGLKEPPSGGKNPAELPLLVLFTRKEHVQLQPAAEDH